jgi:tetratricopeptide (TPR) repeat protein
MMAYSRSTLANVETGRQNVSRDFWQRCDAVLSTGDCLTAQYDELAALVRSRHEAAAAALRAARVAKLNAWLGSDAARAAVAPDNNAGESSITEGDATKRRDALKLGLLSAAATPELVARILDGAAAEALESTRRLGTTTVGPGTFDQLEAVMTDLNSSYSQAQPAEQLLVAHAYRGYVQELIEGRHTLKEARELYTYAGWLSETLAWLAHDLGNPRAAQAYAVDCYEHADQAGHDELCAWACDAMASIALYAGCPERAVKAAHRGIEQAPPGHPLAVRLHAQAARAYAKLGRSDECERFFNEVQELHDRLPTNLPARFDVDTGILADYALTAYPASAYLWLGDFLTAKRHAEDALVVHEQAPAVSHSPSREAIARLDLAIALAALGSPDEAVAHGRQALTSPRIVDSVQARAGDLATALTRRYPRLPEVRAFDEQYRELAGSAR